MIQGVDWFVQGVDRFVQGVDFYVQRLDFSENALHDRARHPLIRKRNLHKSYYAAAPTDRSQFPNNYRLAGDCVSRPGKQGVIPCHYRSPGADPLEDRGTEIIDEKFCIVHGVYHC